MLILFYAISFHVIYSYIYAAPFSEGPCGRMEPRGQRPALSGASPGWEPLWVAWALPPPQLPPGPSCHRGRSPCAAPPAESCCDLKPRRRGRQVRGGGVALPSPGAALRVRLSFRFQPRGTGPRLRAHSYYPSLLLLINARFRSRWK